MNLNNQAYIQSHVHDSAKDIVQAFADDQRFYTRITADQLNGFFGANQDVAFEMKLAVSNDAVDKPLRAGIDRLLETARLPNGWIATDDPMLSAQIRQFLPLIVAEKVLAQDEADALLALAGGPYYEPMDEPSVQAELDRLHGELDRQDTQSRAERAFTTVRDALAASPGKLDNAAIADLFKAAL